MLYSRESVDRACTANRVLYWDLSRHLITTEEAIESEEYEKHKDMIEADKKWHLEHQGDNYESSL